MSQWLKLVSPPWRQGADTQSKLVSAESFLRHIELTPKQQNTGEQEVLRCISAFILLSYYPPLYKSSSSYV